MIVLSDRFLESIPVEKKEFIIKKLNYFNDNLLNAKSLIKDIPHGFWIRRVKNTQVYKFRLNNKDRILFSFVKDNFSSLDSKLIILLEYSTHDKQILKANNFDLDSFNICKEKFDENIESSEEVSWQEKYKNNLILDDIEKYIVDNDSIELLINSDNKNYMYYLSEEQSKCVKYFDKPIMVTGGAGSGKSTVALYKLFSIDSGNNKAIYFTYSDLLKDDLTEKYAIFNKKESKVEFCSIYNFYEEFLNIDRSKIFRFEDFKEWYDDLRSPRLKNLDAEDIWSEIKGIIKGYLGFEGEFIEKKVNKVKKESLSLEEYLKVPKNYSYLSDDIKLYVYNLFLRYEDCLKSKDMYDENDLALEVLKKINSNEFKKYDYVLVDEVQDFSELQLWMMMNLAENIENITFCGDIHQTINPNFFDFGRLKNVYYGQGKNIEEVILKRNYRNSFEVIKYLNKLVKLRKRYIGNNKYDSIESGFKKGGVITYLPKDNSFIENLFKDIKNKHYCAVVVPDEVEKEKLLRFNPSIGARVFTAQEIKGLEYENIYCFNMISANNKIWNEIYNGKGKKNTKYRYFFNQVYVAFSRAIKNLYIFEEYEDNRFWRLMKRDLNEVDNYNKEVLNLNTESTEKDWNKEIERLEKLNKKNKVKENRELLERIRKQDGLFKGIYDSVEIKVEEGDSDLIRYINKAQESFQKRQYANTLEITREALNKYDNSSKLYQILGNTLGYLEFPLKDISKAFNKSFELDRNNYCAYLDYAGICITRDLEEAINVLEKAIKVEPKSRNAYLMLTGVYIGKYDFKKAYESIKGKDKFNGYHWDSYSHVWEKFDLSVEEDPEKEAVNELKEILKACGFSFEEDNKNSKNDLSKKEIEKFEVEFRNKFNKLMNNTHEFGNFNLMMKVGSRIQYIENVVGIEGAKEKVLQYEVGEKKRIKLFKELVENKDIPDVRSLENLFITLEKEISREVYSNYDNLSKSLEDDNLLSVIRKYVRHYVIYTLVLTLSMREIAKNKELKEKIYSIDSDVFIEIYRKVAYDYAEKIIKPLEMALR